MNEDNCSLDFEHSVETMLSVESTVPVVKHVLDTYADVCAKITEHEMLHTVHYVVTCTELFKKEHKLFYEDKDLAYTGVPFIVSTLAKRDCQHGKDRNLKKKAQYKKNKNEQASTDHYCQKNRVILQDTKKFDCPAMVYIKEIVEFPEFKLQKNSVRLRKETSKKLRVALANPEILLKRRKYILTLPDISVHKNHVVGDNAGLSQPISEDLIVKISELVKKGVNTVSEMRRHLEFFVQAEFTPNNNLQSTNKRFFPIDKTIRNHMLNARIKLRRSLIDQECLHDKINEWQRTFQKAMIKFRPKGVNIVDGNDPELKDSLLFIYQDMWQKRLLLRYGTELIFLDATYRTTRYALPLFFLVVKTNIDYQVVAIFVCENETTSAITEALLCIKKWNPTFQPKFCLTDYSNEEIRSLEAVFPGCNVLICDFHREQAWERWLSKTANGCCIVKDAVKLKLHKIAHATTEEICQNAIDTLKDSEEWKSNPKLAEYLNSTWLCNQKRWVFAFRRHRLLQNINTNNGTERLNQSLKYSFLEKRKNSSLTSMLSICIEEFLPYNYENYADKNRRAHSSYRKYKDNIPVYLTNRPQPLVKHCMKMIDKVISMDLVRVTAVTNRLYNVASFQSNSRETYQCYLGDAKHLPSCSCSAWLYSAYPCKHFFAIFIKENLSWSDFDPSYGDSAYFVLDPLQDAKNFLDLASNNTSVGMNSLVDEKPLDQSVPPEHNQSLHGFCSIDMKVSNPDQNLAHGLPQARHTPAACRELLNAIINMTHLCDSQIAIDNLFDELYKVKITFAETLKREQGVILLPDKKPETWIKSDTNLPHLVNLPVRHKRKIPKRVGVKFDMIKAASNIDVISKVKNEPCVTEICTNHVLEENCEMFTVPNESIKIESSVCKVEVRSDIRQEFDEANFVNDNFQLNRDIHHLKCSLIGDLERNDIEKGKMLNDNVIHFFQQLMSNQFNISIGLQDPIKGKVMSFDICPSDPFVQILHDGNLHWICVTTYDCKPGEIYIFDSLFHGSISIATKRQICSILRCPKKKIVIKVLPIQQQTNGVDCGLYAIAWARQVLEANKIPPSTLMFEQSKMRIHLLNCILNNQLDVFPTAVTPSMFRRCVGKNFHIPLHCSCRMFWIVEDEHIFNRQMAQCCTCKKWFHRECQKIPLCAYEKEDAIWNCHNCQMHTT
ncbi:uncharacterized protein LOC105850359 isoform X2 [Hydra vulgaris]|uniref:uncharacterized protein LOC105850359 isoform X2 n=1 Tax=Hydra vulgaris TaxID=6087 RepID=UPI001F5F5A5F|nr:uncharacterized protein LOC105850359 isoform X2 [Hydra vulgaris]